MAKEKKKVSSYIGRKHAPWVMRMWVSLEYYSELGTITTVAMEMKQGEEGPLFR